MRNKHITAEVIADSLSPQGARLTSFIVTVPRIVLAEFNTHRMVSRNSASSRAIPFKTMLKKVLAEPFLPIKWQKDHKGMQGSEYLEGKEIEIADKAWLTSRDHAVASAKLLNNDIGVTKQFCNRLLEPFLYHTIIATASEWQNFLALRAHSAAEIHIQDLAYKMLEVYNASTPKKLKAGEWHVPFGDKMDETRISEMLFEMYGTDDMEKERENVSVENTKVKIATARCARVSYLNYEGTDDYGKDIILHDSLSKVGHWSCFEHCAKAMTDTEYTNHVRGEKYFHDADSAEFSEGYFDKSGYKDSEDMKGWSGNFRGFIQYRKMFEGENKLDSRVIVKS